MTPRYRRSMSAAWFRESGWYHGRCFYAFRPYLRDGRRFFVLSRQRAAAGRPAADRCMTPAAVRRGAHCAPVSAHAPLYKIPFQKENETMKEKLQGILQAAKEAAVRCRGCACARRGARQVPRQKGRTDCLLKGMKDVAAEERRRRPADQRRARRDRDHHRKAEAGHRAGRARAQARIRDHRRHPAGRGGRGRQGAPAEYRARRAQGDLHRSGLLDRRRPGGRARPLQLRGAQHPQGTIPRAIRRIPSIFRTTSCCAPRPRACRCASWRRKSRRSASLRPAACTARTRSTPPTPRCSTRSRALSLTRASA